MLPLILQFPINSCVQQGLPLYWLAGPSQRVGRCNYRTKSPRLTRDQQISLSQVLVPMRPIDPNSPNICKTAGINHLDYRYCAPAPGVHQVSPLYRIQGLSHELASPYPKSHTTGCTSMPQTPLFANGRASPVRPRPWCPEILTTDPPTQSAPPLSILFPYLPPPLRPHHRPPPLPPRMRLRAPPAHPPLSTTAAGGCLVIDIAYTNERCSDLTALLLQRTLNTTLRPHERCLGSREKGKLFVRPLPPLPMTTTRNLYPLHQYDLAAAFLTGFSTNRPLRTAIHCLALRPHPRSPLSPPYLTMKISYVQIPTSASVQPPDHPSCSLYLPRHHTRGLSRPPPSNQ